METQQTAGSRPPPVQSPVRTLISSTTRAATGALGDSASHFHGDGVRYKAKLIGVDPVPAAEGEKMCWDSMMKLKGLEAAARKQGKHKQRVWLKVSSSGLRVVDERSRAELHQHESGRISSLTRDSSDPRALAYVYHRHDDTYSLFYIKTANLADPVLVDIREVCQGPNQETQQEPREAPTQASSLLPLDDSVAPPPEAQGFDDTPLQEQTQQVSSNNELMEVFSIQMEAPLSPTQSSCTPQPDVPQPALSTSQILSMFPSQPQGGSPYSSPPYSPTTTPWVHNGFPGNHWAGAAAAAPWPAAPVGVAAWPAGVTAPPAGRHYDAHGAMPSQGGAVWGGNAPASPATAYVYTTPVNPINDMTAPPSLNQDLLQ